MPPVPLIARMEPDVRASVRAEQMRMLFETPFPGMLLATAFAFALAWHMRGVLPQATLDAWIAIKCAVVLPRMAHAWAFGRRRGDSLAWLRWGTALLFLDGLGWGAAGILLMVPDDPSAMTVIAASLSGVAAIAAFAIHADWRASVAFTGAMLLPVIGYFLWRGDAFGLYGAASIATFLMLLVAAVRRSERHVVELLALRFRNAALTGQISAALERAEQESRSKDVFVANMSHELRTPLHGILGLSRTLSRQVPGEVRETVSLIRRSGEHLLGLINNILEFSRFKAHGIDMHPSEVDVVRVVEDALAMCRPGAQDARLELEAEFLVPRPWVALVDPFRLRQILINLLGNAIKFTDPGGIVHVRVAPGPDGRGLAIVVADTGVGIGPEAMARLFEPFSQGDASASRRHGGTGLGLHITREICRTLGGDIACQSVPGRGSVFEVRLPLERLAESSARAAAAKAVDSGFVVERFGSGTVLLAEDNEVNAIVAEASLRRFGVEVERVASGRDVVERLCTRGARPDIVLLDCQMPEMDGFEACRRVRAYEREHGLARIPIVALTANVFQQDRERCRAAGMDSFLGKPFGEHELQQVLVQHSIVPAGAAGASSDLGAAYAARL